MGNIPVVAEIKTCCESLGDVVTGKGAEAARQRWCDYSEASVIGSGVRSAIAGCQGDTAEAERLGKAMGRATGSALLGGGLLKEIPVLHELATAGDSLGDMFAGGDVEAANKRWGDYSENSVVGSGVRSALAAGRGNEEEARRLGKNMGLATLSATVTAASCAVSVATGGAGGVVACAAKGAVAGAITSAVGSIVENAARGNDIKPDVGGVVTNAVMGGLGGGRAGYTGKAAAGTGVRARAGSMSK